MIDDGCGAAPEPGAVLAVLQHQREALPVAQRLDALLRGGADADAERISEFRFAQHIGCERLVIDLATADGEAAVAPGPGSSICRN